MNPYTEKQFTIPTLVGLSEKQMDVHLKLYQGYVKHVNLIKEKYTELATDKEKNAYLIAELRRRLSFEFNGMRMHEYYFQSFEGGKQELTSDQSLMKAIDATHGSFADFIADFRAAGMQRGIGWVITYQDPINNSLINAWVGDHELGQYAGLNIVAAMDMWEHAYMVDYTPAEKSKYIDAFLQNHNWNIAQKRFELGV